MNGCRCSGASAGANAKQKVIRLKFRFSHALVLDNTAALIGLPFSRSAVPGLQLVCARRSGARCMASPSGFTFSANAIFAQRMCDEMDCAVGGDGDGDRFFHLICLIRAKRTAIHSATQICGQTKSSPVNSDTKYATARRLSDELCHLHSHLEHSRSLTRRPSHAQRRRRNVKPQMRR